MTVLLNPRIWLALILAGLLAFSHFFAYRSGRHAIQVRWDEAKIAQERASQEQAARNRDMQRQAEKRYVVKREGQDRFFVETVKEIRDAAAPLATCPLPSAVRLRLNRAAACARGDTEAACVPADAVPSP